MLSPHCSSAVFKNFPISPNLKTFSSSAVKLELLSNAKIHLKECIKKWIHSKIMHEFICMDSKTLSHRQQWQHIESLIGESFHSILLCVLALSLCIFIRSPYMSSFISLLETTELQKLLKSVNVNFFFFPPKWSLWLWEERDPCGDLPFEEGEGCSWNSKPSGFGVYQVLCGPMKAQEIWCINLPWRGMLFFATDTRYTIVLRMFFVMRTYSLQGRGSRGRGALSRGKHQLPSKN